ncbi:MAG: FG-GAP repeat protein [Flavobacteriales bacterium]|nr:FG-GAP repeat protein [Flavobacteriales bacterium]
MIEASDQQFDDYFGLSVGISGDHAIVGAQYEDHNLTGSSTRDRAGSAYVFVRSGTLWGQLQKVVASDRAVNDQFGVCVAISGDHALVGAFMEDEDEFGNNTLYEAGSVYYLTNDTALMDNSAPDWTSPTPPRTCSSSPCRRAMY